MKDKLNFWEERDIGGTKPIPILSLAHNFLPTQLVWLLKIFYLLKLMIIKKINIKYFFNYQFYIIN